MSGMLQVYLSKGSIKFLKKSSKEILIADIDRRERAYSHK